MVERRARERSKTGFFFIKRFCPSSSQITIFLLLFPVLYGRFCSLSFSPFVSRGGLVWLQSVPVVVAVIVGVDDCLFVLKLFLIGFGGFD